MPNGRSDDYESKLVLHDDIKTPSGELYSIETGEYDESGKTVYKTTVKRVSWKNALLQESVKIEGVTHGDRARAIEGHSAIVAKYSSSDLTKPKMPV